MTSTLHKLGLIACVSLFALSSAEAQTFYTTGTVTISQLQQPYDKHMSIFVSPTPTANCTNAQPFVIQETNAIDSGYPGYDSIAPMVMAAFLYNKDITIRYACSGGFPQITTLWVNQ